MDNTAVGYGALQLGATSSYNTAVGFGAFWEIGASGRRYSREHIIYSLIARCSPGVVPNCRPPERRGQSKCFSARDAEALASVDRASLYAEVYDRA